MSSFLFFFDSSLLFTLEKKSSNLIGLIIKKTHQNLISNVPRNEGFAFNPENVKRKYHNKVAERRKNIAWIKASMEA